MESGKNDLDHSWVTDGRLRMILSCKTKVNCFHPLSNIKVDNTFLLRNEVGQRTHLQYLGGCIVTDKG